MTKRKTSTFSNLTHSYQFGNRNSKPDRLVNDSYNYEIAEDEFEPVLDKEKRKWLRW